MVKIGGHPGPQFIHPTPQGDRVGVEAVALIITIRSVDFNYYLLLNLAHTI